MENEKNSSPSSSSSSPSSTRFHTNYYSNRLVVSRETTSWSSSSSFTKTCRIMLEAFLSYCCCVSHFSRASTNFQQVLERRNSRKDMSSFTHNSNNKNIFSRVFIPDFVVLGKNDRIKMVKENASLGAPSSLFPSPSSTVKHASDKIRLMTDAIEEIHDEEVEEHVIESEYSFWIWLKLCCLGQVTFMCHPPRCVTILNCLLLLFILQGVFGISSAFILLYTSGQRVLENTQSIQQLQIKTFSNYEIFNLLDYTSLAVDSMLFKLSNPGFQVTNSTQWFSLFHYVAGIYKNIIPIDAILFTRYDNTVIAYKRNNLFTIRNGSIEDGTQCQYYYHANFSQQMSESYFDNTFAYSTCNISIDSTKSSWYMPFVQLNNPSTNIRWSPVFVSPIAGELSISVTIPVYVNGTTLSNVTQGAPFILPDKLDESLKNPFHLYGVAAFQLQSPTLSVLLKNSSVLFGDLDLAFITNHAGDLIAVNAYSNEPKYLTAQRIIANYKQRNVLSQLNTTVCQVTKGRICSKFIEQFSYYGNDAILDVELTLITDMYNLSWGVAVATRKVSFADEVVTGGITSVVIFVIIFIFGMFCLFFFVKAISNPLYQISVDMLKLTNLSDVQIDKDKESSSFFSDIKEMQEYISTMRRRLNTFTKYVPEVIVQKVLRKEHGDCGEIYISEQHMSILCCDIEGFNKMAETLDPQTLLSIVNDYMTCVCAIIQNRRGLVDKFNSACITCLFNESTCPINDHEIHACSTALEILEAIENDLNKKHFSEENKIRVNIGINSGKFLCGNVGTNKSLSFSVFGKNLELASKLMELNHFFNTSILIGPSTFEKVSGAFLCFFLDYLKTESVCSSHDIVSTMKGLSQSDLSMYWNNTENRELHACYELVCHKNEASDLQKRITSDLLQIQSYLTDEKKFAHVKSKCSMLLSLTGLKSVQILYEKCCKQVSCHNKARQ
ncbi:hypothetical protein C9374_014114 [Naegleria lovaniensis]|uniref:Guanylate cyclase domain-containing protein n=1 Tax=Naegleria lovaniensis TaxID=51637 RepID=A0AA88H1N0_NAELO|nr:uncharacterized protein C9374_014114 [Naegleria lovaniensis]KAG2389554.1 hypothetical protein C9374_014114 [Naegleria lovaniensis]